MAMSYTNSMENRRELDNFGGNHPSASLGQVAHGNQYQSAPVSTVPSTDASIGNVMSQFQAMSLPGAAINQNGAISPMGHPGPYVIGDGQFIIAPYPTGHLGLGQPADNHYGAPNSAYLSTHGQYPPFVQYPVMAPFTPGPRGGTGQYHRNTDVGHADVPGLDNRRGSYSTNESTPATPYYTGVATRDGVPRVAIADRSNYSTPSPQTSGVGTTFIADSAIKSPGARLALDRTLDELLKKDPAIPRAVPAVFTPPGQMKTLEQSLENRIPGNRNVYIRGLHPTTDDELLKHFTERFGRVETSKAIIDTSTGACKGFGFAKFYDVRDSELCIQGFHRLGYEESFNSRLKAEGDECSTNLYISNLPKTLNEMELGAIFQGYSILSSKILRDSMGNSRGVGFARFETRDICEEVIRKYNGAAIGDEGLIMNIRYADTQGQKELKRITAERRQFRTNEYNIGAYGTPLVGMSTHLYSHAPIRRNPTAAQLLADRIRDRQEPSRVHEIDDTPFHGSNASQAHAEASIATPSEDSDEGVTIHVDSTAANGSAQSSPTIKKEHK